MIDLEQCVWRCHGCASMRPNDKFFIYCRKWLLENGDYFQEGWRFCSDNPECLFVILGKPFALPDFGGEILQLEESIRL